MPPDRRARPGLWRQLREALLDLLFPPRCVGCRRYGVWLCQECARGISRVTGPLCPCCGQPVAGAGRLCPRCRRAPPPIDGIRSAAFFEGLLREAIHRFKYRGVQVLAQPLGQLMVEQWSIYHIPAEVLVPVPLHPTRMAERGYNQATLLAHELAKSADLPVCTDSLRRTRATAPQVSLNALDRESNVQGAFQCLGDGTVDRRVVLIDDLCTTGATLNACCTALREMGARSVWAYTLARPR